MKTSQRRTKFTYSEPVIARHGCLILIDRGRQGRKLGVEEIAMGC